MIRRRSTLLAVTLAALLTLPQGIAVAGEETPSPAVAANTPPTAGDDTYTVTAGTTKALPVLGNDSDAETPTALTVADGFETADGRVQRSADGKALTFTARPADAGHTLSFHYSAFDGTDPSEPATVTVKVVAPPARTVTITMPATVVALRTYGITGAVSPAGPAPVSVNVQQYVGGRWTSWRSPRVNPWGRYGVRFSTNRLNRYIFRAVATWADGRWAVSRPLLVRTSVARIDVAVSGPLRRGDVPYSYRAGCPVAPSGLRRITMSHFTYDGRLARGSIVVSAGAVNDLLYVFRGAFDSRFRIRSLRVADAFYAGGRRTPTQSDIAAMNADNTSAFNCRPVTGNPYRVSQHSYGNAIDINTVRNPYVVGSRIYPSWARTYLNRKWVRAGMITGRGVVATRFRNAGWPWGARWRSPDYQHFSSNGR